MLPNQLKDHGLAIIETAKDHLVAALEAAPEEGWTAVELAVASGLLVDEASFPAVITHHLGPTLVKEGRARIVEKAGLTRYTAIREALTDQSSPMAAATSAPQVWSSAPTEEVFVDGEFPQSPEEAEAEGPPADHEGPWIP
ncbi:MAG: hypothetical protein CMP23_00075 [Rickettsiales bacterium]|nr:hypothetical protein [Rickettsiales bacterium]|tara:strand:- start:1580 stop:2002 length:423 start_codon:yes stop_codon:yes gene_type:complete